MLDVIAKGGIVMYPIILCSIIGLAVFIERLWLVKESIEDVGGREAVTLEKRLPTLSTIANVSTLLGLLGTISGMIKMFNVLSVAGPRNPRTPAGGTAED